MLTRLIAPVLALFLVAAGCNRDPEAAKRRYVENGNKYFEKGKYREASIMYRNALKKDAKYGEAYYRLALTALKMQQPVEAVGHLRRAEELIPKNRPERLDAQIKLAEIYLSYIEVSKRRDAEVVKHVETTIANLLTADPRSFDGHRLQGRFLFTIAQEAAGRRTEEEALKELKKAIEEFRIANSIKGSDPEVVTYLSRSLTVARQFGEAEGLYRDLLGKRKDLSSVHLEYYRLLVYQGKMSEAEAALKQAIQDNPKEHEMLLHLARHYYAQKRRDDVVKVLETLKSRAKEYSKAYQQAGLFYFRLGDGAEAIRQYEDGIKNDPAQKASYQKLIIEVLLAQGKKEEARKVNDTILAGNAKDTDAQGLQASMLLEKGEVQAAINQLQSVVMNAPDNFVAHFNLGRALAEKGEWESARQRYNEAIRIKTDYTPARLALGQLQLGRREFDLALKTANDVLAYDRNNSGARLIRSAANLGLNQTGASRDELNSILQVTPGSQDALFQLGLLNVLDRKFKDAEAAYRKCYDLNPGNSRGLMGQVETVMIQNQPDRAMEVLRAEIQKYPARLEFRTAMGNLAVRSKQYDLAIDEYRWLADRLDKKSPMAGDTYYRLAEVNRLKGDLPAALEAMQKAKEILPNNSVIVNAFAILLDTAGRRKDAKTMYETALRIEAENPIALNNLAFIMATTDGGDLDQALTYAQRAKQKRPQIAEISDTLGMIYLKKDLFDNAIEIFQDCVKKVPKHPTYRYHLGMALLRKGDKVRAKAELQAALANKPLNKEEEDGIRDLLARIG